MNYDEKMDGHMTPYAVSLALPKMAKLLLVKDAMLKVLSQASLRDRFTLLMTNNGILRGESVFKCELSDLFSLITENNCFVLIMQIATGLMIIY